MRKVKCKYSINSIECKRISYQTVIPKVNKYGLYQMPNVTDLLSVTDYLFLRPEERTKFASPAYFEISKFE